MSLHPQASTLRRQRSNHDGRRGRGGGGAPAVLSSDLESIRSTLCTHLPPDHHSVVETYVRTLHAAFCDTAAVVGMLTSDQLRELGVEVGHRPLLTTVANRIATQHRSDGDAPLSRVASTGSQQIPVAAFGPTHQLPSFSRDASYDSGVAVSIDAPQKAPDSARNPATVLPRIASMDVESLSGIPGVLVTNATRAVFEPSSPAAGNDAEGGSDSSMSSSGSREHSSTPQQAAAGASNEPSPGATAHAPVAASTATHRVRPQLTTSFEASLSSSLPVAQSPRGLLQGTGAPSFFLGARPRQLQGMTSFHAPGGGMPLHTRSMRRRSHRAGGQPKSFRGHSVFEDELLQNASPTIKHQRVAADTFLAQSPRPTDLSIVPPSFHRPGSDRPNGGARRPSAHKLSEVEWLSVSGRRPTIAQFLNEMETIRRANGFCGEYDNLFLEHKQMPLLILDDYDYDSFGLLLRIPDLSDEYGTSITTITNRVCFMVHRTARLVVTYHACEEDPFDGFQREWEAGRHASTGIERIAETMIRRVLRTYNKGVAALREAVDELESREPGAAARRLDDTARVQRLSLIAKKSAVYKRCADATRETLAELEDVDWMEPFAKTLCDGLSTVASMTDELASNALASIDLTIALSEFKSNTNLKNFTYMSILLQPVGIATSWYGMNWAHMPELEYENAYYIFAGTAWLVALLIFTRFVLHQVLVDRLFAKAADDSADSSASASTADGEALRPWRRTSKVLTTVVSSDKLSPPLRALDAMGKEFDEAASVDVLLQDVFQRGDGETESDPL